MDLRRSTSTTGSCPGWDGNAKFIGTLSVGNGIGSANGSATSWYVKG